MTDYDKLKLLFDEFGVGYTEEPQDTESDRKEITCEDGSEKIKGYAMFYTVFVFNSDGSFNHMGAYE